MRKGTIFFTCIVLGGTLFAIVFFYLGIWKGSGDGSKEGARQVVVSEGGQTLVAPLTTQPASDTSTPGTDSFGPITVVLAETDQFGYAKTAPQGAAVLEAGAKVLQLSGAESFAVYWLPPETKIDRFLVLLHGTAGTAYDEIGDELASAKAHGYGLIALQWQSKSTGAYQSGRQIYQELSSIFDWLDLEQNVRPETRVLMGFDRGSAAAFEVLSLDRAGRRFFSGAVNLSGGIPSDAILDPKVSTRPDPFFVSLIVGQVASNLYTGLRFYMYCGRQDEILGAKMCEQMSYAQSLAVKYGGKVDTLIASETLGHRGLRTDSVLYQAFVQWFLSL